MPIVAATAADGSDVRKLLDASGLPTADVTAALLSNFLVQHDRADLVAVGGLEFGANSALIRSVAVAPSKRGGGLGRQMVQALETLVRGRGCHQLYLLTTSAEAYFAKLGYERVPRESAPAGIRATQEFSSLCPTSSSLMVKTMDPKILNVLFLCTGNSARSILAEAVLNNLSLSQGKFKGYSAGSHRNGAVHRFTLELLQRSHLPTEGLCSKSWDEFARPDSPPLDFVFTVCDQAAGETCPYWPGQPVTAHWGMPDPAAVEGSEEQKRRAFADTLMVLRRRIELFASLPFNKLDRLALQRSVSEIGKK
jgi:protein-tyrosine-phosphatase/N-acetylglutamate synthase-like GNAT family acetyltransferase